jgi:hypothetical protein
MRWCPFDEICGDGTIVSEYEPPNALCLLPAIRARTELPLIIELELQAYVRVIRMADAFHFEMLAAAVVKLVYGTLAAVVWPRIAVLRECRAFGAGSLNGSRRFDVVFKEVYTPGVFGGWIVGGFGCGNGFGCECAG